MAKPLLTQLVEIGATVPAENSLYNFDRNKHMKFLVDLGSAIYLLPKIVIKRMKLQCLPLTFHATNALPIATFCSYTMMLSLGFGRSYSWQFTIVDV